VRGSVGLASPRRGSGIGLSVVRLLIEAMGGRVQVADNPSGGADFQLLLPGLANP
jgi:signal transduction histidine kinase